MTIQKLKEDVIPDLVLVDTDTVELPAATVTIGGKQYVASALQMDISTSGVGGLDTGSRAADTLYYLYAIVEGGVVKLISSISASSPTGFTYQTLVGKFRTFGLNTDIAAVSSTKDTSEWVDLNPSNTQGFGSITSRLRWRRKKSSVEIQGNFDAGTVTGSEAQIELPNSYAVDFGGPVIPNRVGSYSVDVVSNLSIGIVRAVNSDTYVNFGRYDRTANTNTLVAYNGDQILSNGDTISFYASIPVAEFEDLY